MYDFNVNATFFGEVMIIISIIMTTILGIYQKRNLGHIRVGVLFVNFIIGLIPFFGFLFFLIIFFRESTILNSMEKV